MLLIDCPYCGKRPELEFAYGGQAHLVRPPRPAELSDKQWADYLYVR
ncbi:MAG: soxD 1, partial [Steroidobacteraceae bacterium]|nr:soxD 1 [Steroidobacteraceae bacterium]